MSIAPDGTVPMTVSYSYESLKRSFESYPHPMMYEIISFEVVGDHTILKIRYPTCKNYDGVKILVYKGHIEHDEKWSTQIGNVGIDPHFSDSSSLKSPMARFVPTDEGWEMAVNFCKFMDTCTSTIEILAEGV